MRAGVRDFGRLFLASFLALYFELIVIRYLSSEIRTFAYLKNLPLIASFLGLGLGMLLGRREGLTARAFPFTALALFSVICYSQELGLTHLPLPIHDNLIWGPGTFESSAIAQLAWYTGVVTLVFALVVLFFVPLGGLVSRGFSFLPPLSGYSVNLAGSIGGIIAFTLLSYLGTPPWVWMALGVSALLIFFWSRLPARIILLSLPLVLLPSAEAVWSPYYRISLSHDKPLEGSSAPSVIYLSVNHDYHQKILDLSASFFEGHPGAEPNRSSLSSYDFPYLVHPDAKRVLIVGAGTGNDVASALRHGAERVDAVEIDPVIMSIGKALHPEKPYDSERVSVHVGDARSYLKDSGERYDLVLFAYLDSHTLLANSSSLRLDNYVYTIESFSDARNLLKPEGTLVVAFAGGHSYVSGRLYAMLKSVFGQPPTSYFTGYDSAGVVFVSGAGSSHPQGTFRVMNDELERLSAGIPPATDNWPFLYLRHRSIPLSYYAPFLVVLIAWIISRRALGIRKLWTGSSLHFLALGAAFLLLETKAITELSLLFGSTWMVNTAAILSFLVMAVAANAIVQRMPLSTPSIYLLLFASLITAMAVQVNIFSALPLPLMLAASCTLLALPVFFSGLLFSRALMRSEDPGRSLGINLLGALIGGVSENFVMIGGTQLLGGLAIFFYAVSVLGVEEWKAGKESRPLLS